MAAIKGCPPNPQNKKLPKKAADGESGGGPMARLRKPKPAERGGGIFACADKKKGFDRDF